MAEKLQVLVEGKDKFSKTLSKLGKALPSLKTLALGTSAAIAGLGAALFKMTQSTADTFDSVQKLSDQLGVSTEFISKMNAASEFAGVRQETMRKAMQQVQVTAGEASRGIKTYSDVYDELGISIYNANGRLKDAEALIPEMADAFNNLTDSTYKSALASKVFGLRGMEMLQLFKDGKIGLEAMTEEASKFGLVIDEEAGGGAAEFNDSLTRVQMSLKGLMFEITKNLMPTITDLANKVADWVANNRELITQDLAGWLRDVGIMAKGVGDGLLWIDKNLTEKVLDFFYGPADISKMKILKDQLREYTSQYKLMQKALIAGIPIDERRMELYAGLAYTTQESINELKKEKEITKELVEQKEKLLNATTNQLELMRKIEVPTVEESIIDEALESFFGSIDQSEIGDILADQVEKTIEFYENQKEIATEHKEWLASNFSEIAEEQGRATMDSLSAISEGSLTLSKKFGKEFFNLQKSLGIANATISAYEAYNKNLAAFPYPFGAIMAGIALATGLAQVAIIAKTSVKGQAHAGLTSVPSEGSYLLAPNERVLSSNQNADLTSFLEKTPGGNTVIIEKIEVLPNATNANALLDMDSRVFEEIVEEQIIPALSNLKASGITYE